MGRPRVISWVEANSLISRLAYVIDENFEVLVLINPTGLIPGGMLGNIHSVSRIYTVKIEFPAHESDQVTTQSDLLALPEVFELPPIVKNRKARYLILDAHWGCGRILTSVSSLIRGAGRTAYTGVLHYSPEKNKFGDSVPDYYAELLDEDIIYPWDVRQYNPWNRI